MATPTQQTRGSKRSKKNGSCTVAPFFVLLIILFTFFNGQNYTAELNLLLVLDPEEEDRDIGGWYIDHDAATNAQAIREWRTQNYERACHPAEGAISSKKEEEWLKLGIHTMLQGLFQPPSESSATDFRSRIPSCPLVFMDFGANVGDSLAKMISGGFQQPCLAVDSKTTSSKGDLMLLRPRYEVSTGKVGLPKLYAKSDAAGRKSVYRLENKLIEFVNMFLREALPLEEPVKMYTKTDFPDWKLKNPALLRGPEDYCYIGVEGNPRFTKQLQQLERRIMSGHPRPLQNVHFLTESVITSKAGPTVIYLDNTNEDQNFWGSSILSSHSDVLSSQQEGTPVTGITLTTLFRQTVKKQPGAQVLIKMDVEGAEWEVLNEAYDSGVLCEYSQAGVRIRALIEVHNEQQIGASPEMRRFYDTVIKDLKQCGVLLWLATDAG